APLLDELLERAQQALVQLGDGTTPVADDMMVMVERAGEIALLIVRMAHRLGQAELDQKLQHPVDANQARTGLLDPLEQLRRSHRAALSEERLDDLPPRPGELVPPRLQFPDRVTEVVIANHLQLVYFAGRLMSSRLDRRHEEDGRARPL